MNAGKKTNLLILSISRALAEEFLSTFSAEPKAAVAIGDFLVKFEIITGNPGHDPAFAEQLAKAHAIAIVVRFLDVHSLEKIKNIYHSLPDQLGIPAAIFMLRDKDEADFKISCSACGQKIWLRDADISKRGRCPDCTKSFVILAQDDHLKSQLMLPGQVETFKVTRSNPESFQAALIKLFEGVPAGIKPADRSVKKAALHEHKWRWI